MTTAAEQADYRKYLDPRTLAKIQALDIRARLIVEGFITGMHRSPYKGFSVEFAQHRQYVQGDDAVVLAWLQAQSYGEPVPALRLKGLDPAASYECLETGEIQGGAVLLHHGLRTGLRGDLDAAVFRLRRM